MTRAVLHPPKVSSWRGDEKKGVVKCLVVKIMEERMVDDGRIVVVSFPKVSRGPGSTSGLFFILPFSHLDSLTHNRVVFKMNSFPMLAGRVGLDPALQTVPSCLHQTTSVNRDKKEESRKPKISCA